ncbi:hypothetical protein L1987_59083 [Smallanthus sonchifolius]|uniref:Uncharacterized protein n=1 Tax=Smallanthus sonchifolius TaxID=185202 RepID=A0ACB9D4L2_9ASTR|nr:hypothetical protein L1987_59083 [Smallanthus sonchifolius]
MPILNDDNKIKSNIGMSSFFSSLHPFPLQFLSIDHFSNPKIDRSLFKIEDRRFHFHSISTEHRLRCSAINGFFSTVHLTTHNHICHHHCCRRPPLCERQAASKDDERLSRWKEKLLGCVESNLNAPEICFWCFAFCSNDSCKIWLCILFMLA